MGYVGNEPDVGFTSFAQQTITGNGGTSYTLSHAVANGKEILLYINNIKQEEGSSKAYTASGTTLTLSEAISSSDSCYCVFLGKALQTTVAPDGSVTSAKLANANLEMPNTLDMNGNELILDADGDTSITADTDDQIDFKIGGNDTHVFDANGHVTLKQFLDDATAGGVVTGASNRGDVARIRLFQSATGSDGGEIRFDVANTSNSMTECMRIDSSGRLLIGATSTFVDTDQVLQVSGNQGCNMRATVSNADGGSVLNLQRSGNTQGDYIRFFDSSANETGQIRVDSGGVCRYEDVSDYRLKDNVKDWDVDASAKVKQIKIKTYDWKDQTAVTNGQGLVGVIAHELQEVYPHCVSGEKDGYGGDEDEDGNKKPMYQGVDYGKLTPLLTKALQEALARIETLEAKVTALEGN